MIKILIIFSVASLALHAMEINNPQILLEKAQQQAIDISLTKRSKQLVKETQLYLEYVNKGFGKIGIEKLQQKNSNPLIIQAIQIAHENFITTHPEKHRLLRYKDYNFSPEFIQLIKKLETFTPDAQVFDYLDTSNKLIEQTPIHFKKFILKSFWESAASTSNIPVIQFLQQKGLSLNKRTQSTFTALHYAASNGSINTLKWLLNEGAGINYITQNNKTPLDVSIASQHNDIISFLRERGGIENIKDLQKQKEQELYNTIFSLCHPVINQTDEERLQAAVNSENKVKQLLNDTIPLNPDGEINDDYWKSPLKLTLKNIGSGFLVKAEKKHLKNIAHLLLNYNRKEYKPVIYYNLFYSSSIHLTKKIKIKEDILMLKNKYERKVEKAYHNVLEQCFPSNEDTCSDPESLDFIILDNIPLDNKEKNVDTL